MKWKHESHFGKINLTEVWRMEGLEEDENADRWLQEGAELQIRDMIRVLMKALLFSTKAKKEDRYRKNNMMTMY